jgi:hypothetical protein
MTETVIVLPETKSDTLCIRLTGMVSGEDFTKNFGNMVQAMAERHQYYNLYVVYDDKFEGWSREAADLSFKNISQFGPHARRLAYINAPDSRMLMMKMLSPIMHAEVKYFELSEKDEALEWVLAYKHQE